MPKSNALRFARLVDWVEGRLTEEEAAAIARELERADEATRADVAWLRAFLQVSENIVLASPPPKVREELLQRFEAYAQERRKPGFLQRLMATLTFDSRVHMATAGARAAGAETSQQQLIYSTDVADVALSIQPHAHEPSFDVSGQVMPSGDMAPDIFSVQLLRGTEEFGITTTDDLGEFTFESVPVGTYEMVLSSESFEILIEPVELTM